MEYSYIKALHIIFVVCWFAALFYIVRLFIYSTEAQLKDEQSRLILTPQFLLMQRKLWYIIGWPSFIGTFVFGSWMLYENPGLLSQPWMWIKLILVGLLAIYHIECQRILKKQSEGQFLYSSFKLRLFNELATVFLVAIVFLAVVKSQNGLLWGLLGLIAFAAVLMVGVTVYKKNREKQNLKETKNAGASGTNDFSK
ncbi:MAG: protoporphyrinogen oxidase [Bacteroidetes bacterium]|nr:protoporphyrinogen oxidase [Bacteroidota bacterium]